MKTCKNCGQQFNDEMNFCAKCGIPLSVEPQEYFCPTCGKSLGEAYDSFCPYCGQSFGGADRQQEQNKIQQIEEETKSKSVLKLILRIIGGFILFFIITILGKGLATAAIRNGYTFHFIGVTVILVCVSYYLNRAK